LQLLGFKHRQVFHASLQLLDRLCHRLVGVQVSEKIFTRNLKKFKFSNKNHYQIKHKSYKESELHLLKRAKELFKVPFRVHLDYAVKEVNRCEGFIFHKLFDIGLDSLLVAGLFTV
jgi:hypothetical protein